jgi:hypothetical protein
MVPVTPAGPTSLRPAGCDAGCVSCGVVSGSPVVVVSYTVVVVVPSGLVVVVVVVVVSALLVALARKAQQNAVNSRTLRFNVADLHCTHLPNLNF